MSKSSDCQLLERSNFFDAKWYLELNPDVKKTDLDPIVHYLTDGWKEGRNPSKYFSGSDYYAVNPDVAKANVNPLLHYLKYGIKECREIAPRKNPIVPFEIITKRFDAGANIKVSHTSENISFSVIMPTYNRAGLIERAVDSLLAQTFQKFELIIVDDGSTDNTSEVIQKRYANELANGQIKYLKKENGGCCKARNYGLQHATSLWIAYLDSDNEVYPHFLQTFADAILTNANNCFYAQWDTQSGTPPFRSAVFDFAALVRRNFIDLGVFVHTKQLYDQLGGFDENLTRLVDWELIIRYTQYNNPCYIEKSVLFYNDGNDHVRITNNGAFKENRDKIWDKYRPLISVVIPVSQASEVVVRGAIESLLSQTLKNCEFIFVDDGAFAKSLDVIFEYKDERIRVIKNKFHAGSVISYENGAFTALGKFTIFFDISKVHAADFCEQCYQKLLTNSYLPETPKEMPKVTTLVMTYNHEAYLAEALESVIKQRGDFENEVLILNDASTDNTQVIIDKYVKQYPHLFKDCSNAENIGISANIKKGLALATGKYIAILEGDDSWLSPFNLQEKISFLEQNKDCSCCFSRLQLYKETTKNVSFIEAQENFPEKLKAKDWLPTTINPVTNFSSCVFLAEYLKNLPQAIYAYRFSEIPLCFWLEKTSYLGFINKPLTRYRINDGGVWSGASQVNKIKQMIEVRKIAYKLCGVKYKKVLNCEIRNLSKKLVKLSGMKASLLESFWDGIVEKYFDFRADCAIKKNCARIRKSGLFDREWYLSKNPDVLAAGIDPVKHYLCHGWREGREPGPLFSGKDYLSANPDVKRLKQNPLLHYVRFGKKEGRKIFPVEKRKTVTLPTAWQKIGIMFSQIRSYFSVSKREQKLRLSILSCVQNLIEKERLLILKIKGACKKENSEIRCSIEKLNQELKGLHKNNNELLIANKKLQENLNQTIQREQEIRQAELASQVKEITALRESHKKLEENFKQIIQREQETRRAERMSHANAIVALRESHKKLEENFKQIIQREQETRRAERMSHANAIVALQESYKKLKENFKQTVSDLQKKSASVRNEITHSIQSEVTKLQEADANLQKTTQELVQQSISETRLYFERKIQILYRPGAFSEDLKAWYLKRMKQSLNLVNPQTFNEKIQWMKLYDSTPIKTWLADKYLVREWVKEKIGEKYLIPLLGVWDKFEEIEFDKLPNRFVIKCNHGCAYNIIVKDKSKLNLADVKSKLDKWMSEDFAFHAGYELHYSFIPHKIIVEAFIENEDAGDLYDYKFWCFNGKVEYIQFLSERNLSGLKMAFYDRNWAKQNFVYSYPLDEKTIERPFNLEEMIRLSEIMAKEFPHVRVDLYRLNDGTIYFGEMTFTSASGIHRWNDESINRRFGNLIQFDANKDKIK